MKWVLNQNADRLLKAKDIKTIYYENINGTCTIYCELHGKDEKRYALAVYHGELQTKINMRNFKFDINKTFGRCYCDNCEPPLIIAAEPDKPKRKGFFRR